MMLRNALFSTILLMITAFFFLLGHLHYLKPFKRVLLHPPYATLIIIFVGLLFLNTAAFTYLVSRKFFLKETGRKLSHIDKQFRSNPHEPEFDRAHGDE